MRQIEYQLYEKNPDYDAKSTFDSPNKRSYIYNTYTGLFHCFVSEGDSGEVNAVGVVERPDGTIVTPLASKCRFLKPAILD